MASENGWEPLHAGPDILEWIVVPGTSVHLQVMKGWPSAIMKAYAADYNAFVEPLRDGDSASFTPTNSVSTSNHLNGSAMDLNWDSHPFRVANAGYSPAMIATMDQILDFYTYKGVEIMFWANNWNTPKDAMHHQMGYNTWNNPVVGEFIARFIRADGYSTFRRGGATVPTPPSSSVDVLARATGVSVDKATAILPAVINGLRLSQCNNVNRIAMWLAQMGHESGSFVYTEEIAKNGRYAPYIGRTWIQITWDYNYAAFSKWCHAQGLVDSDDYFLRNYKELADLRWAGIGPAWYWTVSRPKINAQSDAGDLVGVTQAINGGQNGATDRKNRYDRALALGDQLLALTTDAAPVGDDELSAEVEQMIRELHGEYKASRKSPSRSFFAKDQKWGESPLGFEWNVDGNVNEMYMTWGYLLGVTSIVKDVEYVAANGVAPESWAGSLQDDQGKRWLAEVGQQWCVGLVSLRAAMQTAFRNSGVNVADAPQIQYVERPAVAPPSYSGTTGSLVGQAYDALAALQQHSAELPAEARAPIGDLINILKGNLA